MLELGKVISAPGMGWGEKGVSNLSEAVVESVLGVVMEVGEETTDSGEFSMYAIVGLLLRVSTCIPECVL